MPRISVITTTYNDGRFLSEAIESILNQTYSDFEYLIVDDGSDDGITPQIITRYANMDSRIIPLWNPENLGSGASCNKAIDHAQGDLIAIMDGDDISTPDRFEKQIAFLDENPDVEYLGSQCRYVYKHNNAFIKDVTFPLTHAVICWQLFFTYPLMHGTTIGYRKKITWVGKYDPSFLRAQDMDLWRRLVPFTKIANFPEILYYYRIDFKRPASFYRKNRHYPLKVHRKYIEDTLGEAVDNENFNILMRAGDKNDIPLPEVDVDKFSHAIEIINSLYRRFIEKATPDSNEKELILRDVHYRILQIYSCYPDISKPSERKSYRNSTSPMEDIHRVIKNNKELYFLYWKTRMPGGLWQIPFSIFHPKIAFRTIMDKLKKNNRNMMV